MGKKRRRRSWPEAKKAALQEIHTKAEQLLDAAKACLRLLADQNIDYVDDSGNIVSEDEFLSQDDVTEEGAKDILVSSRSSET